MVQNHWGCFGGCLVSKAGASWHTLKSGLGKQRPGGSVKVQTSGHSLPKAFEDLSGAQTPPLGAAAGGAVLCLPSRQNPGGTLKGPGARMARRPACGVGAGPQCRASRLLGVGRDLKPFPMGSLWAEPGGLSVPRRHEVNPQAEKGCDLNPPPPPCSWPAILSTQLPSPPSASWGWSFAPLLQGLRAWLGLGGTCPPHQDSWTSHKQSSREDTHLPQPDR